MLKKTWYLVLLLSLFVPAFTGCNGGSGSNEIPVQPQLVSIEITPAEASIAVDTEQQFVATGIYSDNSTKDLTATAEWSSSDPSVATVAGAEAGTTGVSAVDSPKTTKGRSVYGKGEGTTTISASWGGISGRGRLTVKGVKLVSIEVTPTNPSIALGSAQQFSATGTFSDNTTQDLTFSVNWTSSNEAAATIAPGGTATSVGPGTATITAKLWNVTGSTELTVNPATLLSITVTPSSPQIAEGTVQRFTATGLFSDDTTQDLTTAAAWTSSDPGVAAVDSKGAATAIAPGAVTITATSGGVSGSTTLTVNGVDLVSVSVTPADPAMAKGTTLQFTATGTYSDDSTQDLTATVTWTSSNTGVATISNAAGSKGLATSASAGSSTIKAASGNISGSTALTVNPAALVSISVAPSNETIAKGTTMQFTATGTYSDNSTQDLTAAVTWSSSNTAAATISNAAGSRGLATSVTAGSTTISAVSGSVSGTAGLSVIDRSISLTWDAPTTNTDGTALTDLAGYKLYYGTSPGVYTTTVTLGTATSHVINDLSPGTYYFAVTAVNSEGAESECSNEAWKTVR